VAPTQVAEWAGHSVEILLRVYPKRLRQRPNRQAYDRGCFGSRRLMTCRGRSHMPNRGRCGHACSCAHRHVQS
jgi:hypothetical protein